MKTDQENNELGLIGDVPFGEQAGAENILENEPLKFKNLAEVLAESLMYTEDPITVGVYGRWGVGKTTMMRLIKARVEKENTAMVPVWFNAWQYEQEEHLIIPLVATIARQIDHRSKGWSEELKKGSEAMGRALRSVLYGFSVKGKLGIPCISEAEINLSPKDMIERFQELSKDTLLSRSLYFDAFEELESLARKKEKSIETPKIVVFVDDLDRCFPDRAIKLLESIKLVLSLPGFSFVLGINEKIIREYVKVKYRKDYEIPESNLTDYLEKIVQVPVYVPRPEENAMDNYIRGLIDKAGVFDEDANKKEDYIKKTIPVLRDANDGNPRAIVRMINSLMVHYRLLKKKSKEAEKSLELDSVKLLIGLALDKPKYEELKRMIEERIPIEFKNKAPHEFSEQLEEYLKIEEEPIEELIAKCLEKYQDVVLETGQTGKVKKELNDISDEMTSTSHQQALRVLADSPSLVKILSSKQGIDYLKNPELRNAIKDVTASSRADESGEIDWEEVKRQVTEEGKDPFEVPAIKDLIKECKSVPPFARPYIENESLELISGLDITSLDLKRCSEITDLTPIGEFEGLEVLNLFGCEGITDLGPLSGLENLKKLNLRRCSGIEDLSPLSELKNLEWLNLRGCKKINDVTPLNELENLKLLVIRDCTGIQDLTPIKALPNLEEIRIKGSNVNKSEAPQELKKAIIN